MIFRAAIGLGCALNGGRHGCSSKTFLPRRVSMNGNFFEDSPHFKQTQVATNQTVYAEPSPLWSLDTLKEVKLPNTLVGLSLLLPTLSDRGDISESELNTYMSQIVKSLDYLVSYTLANEHDQETVKHYLSPIIDFSKSLSGPNLKGAVHQNPQDYEKIFPLLLNACLTHGFSKLEEQVTKNHQVFTDIFYNGL